MLQQDLLVISNNALQNLGSPPPGKVTELGNLSIENPTVEQVNAGIQRGGVANVERNDDPAFGEHIREAVGAVRRIFR